MKYDNLNQFDLTQLRRECMQQICHALASYSQAAKLDNDDELFDAKLDDYMTSHRKLALMIARRLGYFQVDCWHDEFEIVHLYNEIEKAAETYDGSEFHDSFEEIPTYLEEVEDPAPKERVLNQINAMDDQYESQKDHSVDELAENQVESELEILRRSSPTLTLEQYLGYVGEASPTEYFKSHERWKFSELEAQAHKHDLKGVLYSKDFWKDFCQRHQYRSELWDKQAA